MSLPAPVVFLPGIMGSSLRDEYPVTPEQVWNVGRALIKSYERITLHPSDLRYEVVEPSRVSHDAPFTLFYEEPIEELRYNLATRPDLPVPVYPFAYDWRQPLAVTQSRLREFIDEVIDRTALMRHYHEDGYRTKTGKVNLVGHSMGGLIIAGYIADHGVKRVDKVATIATPFRGSLESIAKTTLGVGGFSFGGGSSREREAARVTPALYHLLPSFDGAIANIDPYEIFNVGSWQWSILDTIALFIERHSPTEVNAKAEAQRVLGGMLRDAAAHRRKIEELRLEDSRIWLSIVGIDEKTRLTASVEATAGGGPHFNLRDQENRWKKTAPSDQTGDGTVPFLGALSAFVPEEEVVCVRPADFGFFEIGDRILKEAGFHSSLPNMNFVQRSIISHLLGRPGQKGGTHSPRIKRAEWRPPVVGLK